MLASSGGSERQWLDLRLFSRSIPGWDVGMLIVSDQNILRQRPPITVFDLDSSNVMNICLFGYVWMICHSKWMLPRDE